VLLGMGMLRKHLKRKSIERGTSSVSNPVRADSTNSNVSRDHNSSTEARTESDQTCKELLDRGLRAHDPQEADADSEARLTSTAASTSSSQILLAQSSSLLSPAQKGEKDAQSCSLGDSLDKTLDEFVVVE